MKISESLNLNNSLDYMVCYFTDSSSIEYEFRFLDNKVQILVLQEIVLNTCMYKVYTFPIHLNKIHWNESQHNGNKLPADVINEANNFINKMVKLKHLI
tara:strand:+ start:4740 stop:5036 length:297 start_codon:yes stop_codon:yes gene_type:complete